MDSYRSVNGYRREARPNHVLDAVVAYRYFAPGKLARDEAHERILAEAALCRLLDRTALAAGRPRPLVVVRHRLGDLLIRFGTTLQGVHAATTTVPTAADPEPATS